MATPSTILADEERHWREILLRGEGLDRVAFAEFALDQVSRTFALNIKVLPQPLRQEVMIAYLFCRMADTLEDDPFLPENEKINLLHGFADLFSADSDLPTSTEAVSAFISCLPQAFCESQKWEHLLLRHAGEIFPLFSEFPSAVRKSITRCVREMCSGMGHFTHKQAQVSKGLPLIGSLEDLDRYCYYVAGTVGLLLCDLFTHHSPLIGKMKAKALRALAVSFGLGLQLTNILKDINEDNERSVSFLPQSLLNEVVPEQSDFFRAGAHTQEKIIKRLLGKTKAHLEDALDYSCLLPRLEPRLRLFCLWPLFMAAETLVLLAEKRDELKEGHRLKISRTRVEKIVRKTSLICWSNHLIRAQFRRPMRRLEAILSAKSA